MLRMTIPTNHVYNVRVPFSKMSDQPQNIANWLDETNDKISNVKSILSDHENESEQKISDVSKDETDSLEHGSNKNSKQNIHSSKFYLWEKQVQMD